jgi:hypothetical protein
MQPALDGDAGIRCGFVLGSFSKIVSCDGRRNDDRISTHALIFHSL